jgi:serine/threonine-protein kinase
LLAIVGSAHEHGILHRDVTPANIFVTREGEIKLLDFGIARLRDADSGEYTVSVPGALGTPAFMPPEQARGLWEELDARSDLWAVGAVMFRALTGRSVHQGRSPSEQLLSAMTRRAPPLVSVMPEVFPAIATIVDRAMEIAPAKRWPDAKTFRAAIDDAYAELAGHDMASAPPLEVPVELVQPSAPTEATHADGFGTTVGSEPRSQPSRRWMFALAAAGVAAVVALAWTGSVSSRAASSPPKAEPSWTAAVAPSTAATVERKAPAPAAPATTEADTEPAEPTVAKPAPSVIRHTKMKPSARPAVAADKPKPAATLDVADPMFDSRTWDKVDK